MATSAAPPLDEFIDLKARRLAGRKGIGFPELENAVTVAVYQNKTGFVTLTVRISEDIAESAGLKAGMHMECLVHPDGDYIAIKPTGDGGSKVFRPKGSRSYVYQTTLKAGTIDLQPATRAGCELRDGALILTLKSAVTQG